MKWLLIGVQFAGVALAVAVLWFFPITRMRAAKTRELLDTRKGKAGPTLEPVVTSAE
jgi:hypothetical protein